MKKKWILALASTAAVFAIVTLSVMFLFQKPVPTAFVAGQTVKTAHGKLFVNAITPSGGKIGMPPDADSVDFKREDLTTVFGRAPIPALPKGFAPDSDVVSALMFRSGSVFLMNGITYSMDAADPKAARVVFDLNDKGELPLADCVFGGGTPSMIEGVEMLVGLEVWQGEDAPFDVYTATFVANDIGYRIRGMNVTAEEFLDILVSVVKG